MLRRAVMALGLALMVLAGVEAALRVAGLVLAAGPQVPGKHEDGGERVITILCVGDSWTQGAPYGRYPETLAARLNARGHGVRFRQINLGRAGTNSSQMLARLPREIARYHPDLLLVLTGNNDHHNLTDSTYWRFRDASLGRLDLAEARARVFLHSLRVFRLGRTVWQQATGHDTANEFFQAGRPASEAPGGLALDVESHHRQLEYNLIQIIDLARRERVPLVLQTYFHFHGYHVNEIIRDVATRYRVPLVDHNLLFHTEVPAERRASLLIEDGHPNAAGYALMADNVLAALDRYALVP